MLAATAAAAIGATSWMVSATAAQPASPREAEAGASALVGTSAGAPALERRLREAEVRSVRPVGRDGVRLAVGLSGRLDAELVPRRKRDPEGWRHELAAHRLARALSLAQVPPAAERRLARNALESALEPSFRDAWPALAQRLRWEPDGTVRAAMVWRPRTMRVVQPAAIRYRGTWRRWLAQRGAGPGDDRRLAADLSTLVAFDYLVGRPRRVRGGHLRGTPSGDRLFIDRHARAFEAPLPRATRARLRERVLRVERFSRGFVAALLDLGDNGMREALKAEPAAADLAVEGAVERRATLLSHVGALVEQHGEGAVLAFP